MTRVPSQQLTLEIPGLGALEVEPTPAMRKGRQSVFQCAWCGCVVVQPQPADHPLAACPSCQHPDRTWWAQQLPVAGLQRPGTGHLLDTTGSGL